MAACISKLNECSFCIGAHSAASALAFNNKEKVDAVLSNLDMAPIDDNLKSVLRMLRKVTMYPSVEIEDMRKLMDSGISPKQIEDALAVCFAFNVTNRLADAFGFEVPDAKSFEAGAKYLLKHGYK